MSDDRGYISQDSGIIQVPHERWVQAQKAERHLWMEEGLWWASDRNEDHERYFDHYKVLQGQHFANVIELGCGPFTNMRLIAKVCKIDKVDLLDPLLESYLTHPGCSYSRSHLYLQAIAPLDKRLVAVHKLRNISRALSNVAQQLVQKTRGGARLNIGRVLPMPIEHMDASQKYDLIVMINVLEHCFDFPTIVEKVKSISHSGSVFVFHDKYYSHKEVLRYTSPERFDAYHPLRIDRAAIDSFLTTHFDALYQSFEEERKDRNVETEYSEPGVFFIGKRK